MPQECVGMYLLERKWHIQNLYNLKSYNDLISRFFELFSVWFLEKSETVKLNLIYVKEKPVNLHYFLKFPVYNN